MQGLSLVSIPEQVLQIRLTTSHNPRTGKERGQTLFFDPVLSENGKLFAQAVTTQPKE